MVNLIYIWVFIVMLVILFLVINVPIIISAFYYIKYKYYILKNEVREDYIKYLKGKDEQ